MISRGSLLERSGRHADQSHTLVRCEELGALFVMNVG
jgi:hypothetical protein